MARLTGTAQRHAPRRAPTGEETAAAVAELREIADGRGDLLAEAAGLITGYYRGTAEEMRAGTAALDCGRILWPTMVLAGKLDQMLARRFPGAGSAADFHARYLDAGTRLALPAPPGKDSR